MIFLAHYSTFVAASGYQRSCRNRPLGPKMGPNWSQNGPQNGVGNSSLEGSIFDANFKLNLLHSGLPKQPPEGGAGGR